MSKCTAINDYCGKCQIMMMNVWSNILHFDKERGRRREMKVYREDETTLCWCTILLLTCLCRKKGGYYKVGHRVR